MNLADKYGGPIGAGGLLPGEILLGGNFILTMYMDELMAEATPISTACMGRLKLTFAPMTGQVLVKNPVISFGYSEADKTGSHTIINAYAIPTAYNGSTNQPFPLYSSEAYGSEEHAAVLEFPLANDVLLAGKRLWIRLALTVESGTAKLVCSSGTNKFTFEFQTQS